MLIYLLILKDLLDIYFKYFIETYNYISISITSLLDKNIVHFDIKEDNILYSTKYENPILIDFGLSIPIDVLDSSNLKNYFYVYAPDYYLWPIEVHAINHLLYLGTLTNETIRDMVNKYVDNNSGLKVFSQNFKDNYQVYYFFI